ncbi:hypothetical protein [Saccharothrix sp.]|uniref:hypothetical protein n=1 Tax=Saccharothrix sp. TaxID=1873460 RepID=UPI002810A288|nr:hypothetical protein [Saccharothrix sp.]
MFKKAAAATAITAALMAIGSPAFAEDDIDVTEQVGLVNLEETDIVEQLNVCNIEVIQLVNVELPIVPIDSYNCENTEVEVEVED